MSYDPVKAVDQGNYYEEDEVVKKSRILLIANIFGVLVALANFSVCIWIRFDLDFWEWVIEIQWYTYWNAMYVVMIAMLFHTGNFLLTAYGTWAESRPLLLLATVLRFFIWFLTLAGAIVICMYGVEESDFLVAELNEVFMGLIYRWDQDERASRVMTMIQEYVGCCGAGGNRDDYVNARKPVPDSCRHPVTGNNYRYECPQVVAWWLEPWTGTLAGISTFFCVYDFFIAWLALKLRSALGC